MTTKTILLTGGLGYIGAHTAVELLRRNFDVVLADNLSNTVLDVLDAIARVAGVRPTLERVELCDAGAVAALFHRYRFDGVIHLAAHKAAGDSVARALQYYENNLISLIHVLMNMLRRGLDNIVFSSSSAVYGNAQVLPITESVPVRTAESPYGTTKIVGEDILRDTCRAHAMHAVVLRCFNPVGAHPTGQLGELALDGAGNLLTVIADVAAGLRPAVKVYGTDYPTPDGTCIRDYLHVCDLARAHVAALDRLLAGESEGPQEVFNIGAGRGRSVREMIDGFERVTGAAVPWEATDRRSGDLVCSYADIGKAARCLSWQPTLSLDDAMTDAWRWARRRRQVSAHDNRAGAQARLGGVFRTLDASWRYDGGVAAQTLVVDRLPPFAHSWPAARVVRDRRRERSAQGELAERQARPF